MKNFISTPQNPASHIYHMDKALKYVQERNQTQNTVDFKSPLN